MKKYRKKTFLEVVGITEKGYLVQNEGDSSDRWVIDPKTFESTYEELKKCSEGPEKTEAPRKDLGITEVRKAKENISDLQVYGDGDTFALLCKASSQSQGWMKSTKVANIPGGCIVQVTTQQRNPDGSNAVAEALTYVPGVHIDKESNPRRFIKALA